MHVPSNRPSGPGRLLPTAAALVLLAAVGGAMFVALPHDAAGERRGLSPPSSPSRRPPEATPRPRAADAAGRRGTKPRRARPRCRPPRARLRRPTAS